MQTEATTPMISGESAATNPAVELNSIIVKSIEGAVQRYMLEGVKKLSEEYGFDLNEAFAKLNLDATKLVQKPMAKRGKSSTSSSEGTDGEKEKKTREKKIPRPFSCYPQPWTGCQAICVNHNLFTPCENPVNGEEYCAKCVKSDAANKYGTVDSRANGGAEWKDNKGRKPAAYTRVLEDLKIDVQFAVEHYSAMGIEIPAADLVEVKKRVVRKKGDTSSDSSSEKESEKAEKVAQAQREKDLKAAKAIAKALAEQGKSVADMMAMNISEEIANEAIHNHSETLRKRKEAAEKRKAAKKGTTTVVKAEPEPVVEIDTSAPAPEPIQVPVPVPEPVPVQVPVPVSAPAPQAEQNDDTKPKPKAKAFSHNGVKYGRDSNGDIFDLTTKSVIGKYTGVFEAKTDLNLVVFFDEEEAVDMEE